MPSRTVGITERAAQTIVTDLEAAGYLHRARVGRRNQYTVNPAGRFRHRAHGQPARVGRGRVPRAERESGRMGAGGSFGFSRLPVRQLIRVRS